MLHHFLYGIRRIMPFLVMAVALTLLSANSLIAAEITYRLSIPQPQTHMIQVEMTLDGARGDEVIGMPVWTPGSYLIREFERNVQDISATGHNQRPLNLAKIDKNHWRIDASWQDKQIVIRYRVYAFEHSVRTSFVNAEHALINGASVFMYWQKHQSVKHTVQIDLPENWLTISTSLKPFGVSGNRIFHAADYDELVDSPIEMGNQHEIRFEIDGKPHIIALYGASNYNDAALVKDFTRIINAEKALWGSLPYDRYLFIFHLGNGGGGLEHKNSSVMFAHRWTFTDPDRYHGFLSLVSHEFFHTWNIKRLRPVGLGPFNYDQEAYTKNLWIVEGITSYYDELMLLRAGIYTAEDYLKAITKQINRLEDRPGRYHQTLSEASWDAWIKYYRQDEHSENSIISYYNKGALAGLLLNLKILEATDGKQSLDDVMRRLWRDHVQRKDAPYTAADFQATAELVAGTDLDNFFADYISGTMQLPYTDYFNFVGLKLDTSTTDSSAYLGLVARGSGGKYIVRRVIDNAPAWLAGINVDDELIALNGFRVRQFPPAYLKECHSGDQIIITVSRDDILQDIPVVLGTAPQSIKAIKPIDQPTDKQRSYYQKWLGQAWPASE